MQVHGPPSAVARSYSVKGKTNINMLAATVNLRLAAWKRKLAIHVQMRDGWIQILLTCRTTPRVFRVSRASEDSGNHAGTNNLRSLSTVDSGSGVGRQIWPRRRGGIVALSRTTAPALPFNTAGIYGRYVAAEGKDPHRHSERALPRVVTTETIRLFAAVH